MTLRLMFLPLAALLLAGCRPKPEPQPGPATDASHSLPLAPASGAALASASAAPGPSGSAAPAATEVPELGAEALAGPPRKLSRGLGTIEGAVVLWEGPRLGRLTEGGVEWLDKKIPPGGSQGDNRIAKASGRWPDEIGVVFVGANDRSPDPSYFPLTGKGAAKAIGSGGVPAYFTGEARLGETTIVSFTEPLSGDGSQMAHVRGPFLARPFITPQKAGCTEEETTRPGGVLYERTAVDTFVFGATRDGTLLSVGSFCRTRGHAAELWDKSTKGDKIATSRIVDLRHLIHEKNYYPQMLQGSGDEAWFFDIDRKSPILQYSLRRATSPFRRGNAVV